jgi:hypothetical protein
MVFDVLPFLELAIAAPSDEHGELPKLAAAKTNPN